MKKVCLILMTIVFTFLQACDNRPKNTWATKPFINAFGEEAGSALFVDGENLSPQIETAQITFTMTEDLISGGYKQFFTFYINGTSSWGEDQINITAPTGEVYIFDIYDGLLFNIDYESNEISRFIELFNYEFLECNSGNYKFSFSTKGFLNLYQENFLQPTS